MHAVRVRYVYWENDETPGTMGMGEDENIRSLPAKAI